MSGVSNFLFVFIQLQDRPRWLHRINTQMNLTLLSLECYPF